MKRIPKRLLPLALAVSGVVAACGGSGAAEGVLPEGPPQGEVVDLEFDSQVGRLLRAHPGALYESRDGGATWQAIPLPRSVAEGRITDVATAADAEGVVYVAGPGVGVLASENNGRSWRSLQEGLPSSDVLAFGTHAAETATLFAFLEDEGIYRTEDAGESWTRMDAGPGVPVREFLHSGMEGSMQTGWLFAATDDGVSRSMDCFCGWRPTGELAGGAVYDVAYDPRQPERVYAATANGLLVSENGGEHWQPAAAEGPAVTAVAVDDSGTLYAATRDGSVFRSTDHGRTWGRTSA